MGAGMAEMGSLGCMPLGRDEMRRRNGFMLMRSRLTCLMLIAVIVVKICRYCWG